MKGRGYYFSSFSRNVFYGTVKCIIPNPILKKKKDKSSEEVKIRSSLLLHEPDKYVFCFILCYTTEAKKKYLPYMLIFN
jgi:hypothetical protein